MKEKISFGRCHVMRHHDPASQVLFWSPPSKRRRGPPTFTLQKLIEHDTGLQEQELIIVMNDREIWKTLIMSPPGGG